jgi:hypothetical protein
MGDFNQDGYDELVLNYSGGSTPGTTIVAAAADANNINAPTPFKFTPPVQLDALLAMAVGDFKGDGQREIAGIRKLASGEIALAIYTVDSKTLAITKASELTLNTPGVSPSSPINHASIASGRFTIGARDQLAVLFVPDPGTARLAIVDFAP